MSEYKNSPDNIDANFESPKSLKQNPFELENHKETINRSAVQDSADRLEAFAQDLLQKDLPSFQNNNQISFSSDAEDRIQTVYQSGGIPFEEEPFAQPEKVNSSRVFDANQGQPQIFEVNQTTHQANVSDQSMNSNTFEPLNFSCQNHSSSFNSDKTNRTQSSQVRVYPYQNVQKPLISIQDHSSDKKAEPSKLMHHKSPKRLRTFFSFVLIFAFLAWNIALGFLILKEHQQVKDLRKELLELSAPSAKQNLMTSKTLAQVGYDSVAIADKVSPAVVAIGTNLELQTMFGTQEVKGAGSGVIIDPRGYIVTNNHVIEGSSEVSVTFANGKKVTASIAGYDAQTDLAVLKVPELGENEAYPALSLADSSQLRVGQPVWAIGNPTGQLAGSVTQGIVSALNREVSSASPFTQKITTVPNAIQTDAAINSGNSGGALVNANGELIGINVIKAARNEDGSAVDGIGFAIPSNTVKDIATQLIDKGVVSNRPYIGIRGQGLSQEMIESYKMPPGVFVTYVEKGSPAEKAGIRVNDIITDFDEKPVSSIVNLSAKRNALKVGDSVKVQIWRSGEKVVLDLILGESPSKAHNN